MSLKKQKSQGKAIEVIVNSKEENSSDFCLDFVQEFGLWAKSSLKLGLSRARKNFSFDFLNNKASKNVKPSAQLQKVLT